MQTSKTDIINCTILAMVAVIFLMVSSCNGSVAGRGAKWWEDNEQDLDGDLVDFVYDFGGKMLQNKENNLFDKCSHSDSQEFV